MIVMRSLRFGAGGVFLQENSRESALLIDRIWASGGVNGGVNGHFGRLAPPELRLSDRVGRDPQSQDLGRYSTPSNSGKGRSPGFLSSVHIHVVPIKIS